MMRIGLGRDKLFSCQSWTRTPMIEERQRLVNLPTFAFVCHLQVLLYLPHRLAQNGHFGHRCAEEASS